MISSRCRPVANVYYGFVTIGTLSAPIPKKSLEQQRCSISQERCSLEQQSNAGESPVQNPMVFISLGLFRFQVLDTYLNVFEQSTTTIGSAFGSIRSLPSS
jgi:hypothetical protein